MNKGYRGLTEESCLLEKLCNGGSLHEVVEIIKKENQYWLGIRDNKVMVYFMGGKILEISDVGTLSFDPKYVEHCNGAKMDKYFPSVEAWRSKQELLEKAISDFQNGRNKTTVKHKEKITQQEIMLKNNRIVHTNWFLVDMEYSASGCPCGRFDMIAVSKHKTDGKHQIALIELKSGTNAFGGTASGNYGSGIAGHIHKFYEFLFGVHATKNINQLAEEIVLILSNYRSLGLNYGGLQMDKNEIDMTPENIKCVLLCTDVENTDEAVCRMKKYIFHSKGASKYCLEKLWGNAFDQKFKKMNLFTSVVNEERTIDNSTFKTLKR